MDTTEAVDAVQFEINCGILRRLGIEETTRHTVVSAKGYMTYSYASAPPPTETWLSADSCGA